MKTIITVVGLDQVGIIAGVCNLLAKSNVNVLDINQSISNEFFNMIMVVDIDEANVSFDALSNALTELSKELNVTILIQHESIFQSMHRI